LCFDDSSVYGFGRNQYIHHGAHVGIDGATIFHFKPDRDALHRFTHYRAFAISREPTSGVERSAQKGSKRRRASDTPSKHYRWTRKLPVLARALVLARNTLFLAGPPDIFAADKPAAALDGQMHGLLYAVSTADGKELGRYKLDSTPVFDGMAAAYGRLYVSMKDGSLLCLAEE
jgi:hypothetical protein